jgi:hypothetical protein
MVQRTGLSQRSYLAILFAAAFVLYMLPAALVQRTHSPPEAYFDQLASSFLHGQVSIAEPASNYDLTQHAGRWYVPFPPLPALLMLPWMAIFGNINTVVFSALIGAANVSLVFLLLESLAGQGWTSFTTGDNAWIAALFGFGTVHWYLSTQGTVWALAQICTVTFAALAVWQAARGSPVPAGGALALAMLARPNIVLMFPLIAAAGLQHMQASHTPRRADILKWLLLSGIPIVLAAAALLFYNWLRFGNYLDFGYRSANVALQLVEELNEFGQFSLHYIKQNLRIMLFGLPEWDGARHRLAPNGLGMSLFLTTPAFLYLFKAWRVSPLTIGAWISTALLLIPVLTYYNPGWHQFGYRFSLDFTVPLLVWLAAGLRERPSVVLKGLIVLSVLINAWGTAWFIGLY